MDNSPYILSKRRTFLKGLAGGAAMGAISWWPVNALAANCIGGNSGFTGGNRNWRIFQNANPPVDNTQATAQAYPDWPCTDAASMQSVMNSSTWSGNSWLYVWSNRAMTPNVAQTNTYNPKPNIIQSVGNFNGDATYRVQYTTYEKANAATQSLIRYWLGMSNYQTPWIQAGGLASDFVFVSQLAANPSQYFTQQVDGYSVMTDVPWLPSTLTGGSGSFTRATAMKGNSSQVPGIVLDYEVQDGRSTTASPAFLQTIYSDVHSTGAKLFIYTDPLDRLNYSKFPSGLDVTNLSGVLQNTDYLSVQLWSGNQQGNVAESYETQISLLKGSSCATAVNYAKLVIVFELYNTLNDAQFVNNLLNGSASTNPQAIMYWRNGATEGGPCSTGSPPPNSPNNLIIATLQGSAGTGQYFAPTAPVSGWSPPCPLP